MSGMEKLNTIVFDTEAVKEEWETTDWKNHQPDFSEAMKGSIEYKIHTSIPVVSSEGAKEMAEKVVLAHQEKKKDYCVEIHSGISISSLQVVRIFTTNGKNFFQEYPAA